MSRTQKITCRHCGERAIIRSTEWKTADFADVYCQCKNIHCGHTWVMHLSHSHTLVPSGLDNSRIKLLIESLKPSEKQLALDILGTG